MQEKTRLYLDTGATEVWICASHSLFKLWLAQRPTATVKLKFPDGSVAEIKNLTQAQMEQRMAQHLSQTQDSPRIILPE